MTIKYQKTHKYSSDMARMDGLRIIKLEWMSGLQTMALSLLCFYRVRDGN